MLHLRCFYKFYCDSALLICSWCTGLILISMILEVFGIFYFSCVIGDLSKFVGEFFDKFDAVIVGYCSFTTKVFGSFFF